MFPFLRFSAVMASIVVASTAFGFGLATTVMSAVSATHTEISNGPRVASPGSESRENLQTRSIAGYTAVNLKTRSLSLENAFAMVNSPTVNQQGPMPGLSHANLGQAKRALISSCLMAMN